MTRSPTYTKVQYHESYPAIDPARPELSTAGKVVLITGGGSGVGVKITEAFATSGATKISILGRTSSSLLKAKQEIENAHPGARVLTFVADIVNESAVNKAFSETEKTFGKIDIFVSNAAYLPKPATVASTDIEDWFKGMEINVKGALILNRAFLKHSAQNPIVVHISTAAVHISPVLAELGGYAVSKLAAVKVMEYFAAENPHVRVHLVHPGVLETAMAKKAQGDGDVVLPPFDDVSLPASFTVWVASPEAEFLRNKFVWSRWDVEELILNKEHLLNSSDLTIGLIGWQ